MNQQSQETLELLKARHLSALERYGAQNVADIRDSISTLYPPPSDPGTPPHQRTGGLVNGVAAVVVEETSSATLTVSSSRVGDDGDVPIYLEFGHNLTTVGERSHKGPATPATFHNLAPLSPGSGVDPQGVSFGTVVERPYMRPQLDRIVTSALADIAALAQTA